LADAIGRGSPDAGPVGEVTVACAAAGLHTGRAELTIVTPLGIGPPLFFARLDAPLALPPLLAQFFVPFSLATDFFLAGAETLLGHARADSHIALAVVASVPARRLDASPVDLAETWVGQ
jgi:hypothetical protein